LGSAKKRAAEAALKGLTPGLLRCTDLEDRPGAWELNQRTICGVDKTSWAAGSAAGVPHRAVIDDIRAPVRREPQISRAVERGRISLADERLVTGVIPGKVLEADLKRQFWSWLKFISLTSCPTSGAGELAFGAENPKSPSRA